MCHECAEQKLCGPRPGPAGDRKELQGPAVPGASRQAKSERLVANAMSNAIDISLISPHIILPILYIYMCVCVYMIISHIYI